MAKQVKKPKAEIATIDCSLVTIETATGEFGFDTANQIGVEPQIETEEAVKLIVKGILRAQKQEVSTITGNQITLSDNLFNPELVLIMQGGEIVYDPENPDEIVGYNPPVAGSADKGEVFKLNAYTAQYDASGQIVKYEKITYPNCQGVPVAFGSEDGVFRAPEYTINSAPKNGEPPYRLVYVKQLPALVDEYSLSVLEVESVAGASTGMTAITVTPIKEAYNNKYYTKQGSAPLTLPQYGTILDGTYLPWNGVAEILVTGGNTKIAIVETDASGKVLAGGTADIVAAP